MFDSREKLVQVRPPIEVAVGDDRAELARVGDVSKRVGVE
jgi:hypothetical protein